MADTMVNSHHPGRFEDLGFCAALISMFLKQISVKPQTRCLCREALEEGATV